MRELAGFLDGVVERIVPFKRFLTFALIGVALALMWWGYSSLTSGKAAKVESKLNRETANAAIESGTDAVNTVGAVGASAEQSDQIGRENADAIRNAPGASAPVDPAANAAGLRSLCRRAANRERAECLQRVTPG